MRRPHWALHSVRSFDLGRIECPEQSVALHLQILNPAAYNLLTLSLRPTHFVADWLSSETNLSRALFLPALVRSSSPCSVWNAHAAGERFHMFPAMGSTPAKVIRRADAYNHTVTESPVGVQSKGTEIGTRTGSHSQATIPSNVLLQQSGGYNI